MSRKTRRNPNRPRRTTPGPALIRVESGAYETADGKMLIENRNDGKREACWVAQDKASGKMLTHGATLREVRRKLPDNGAAWAAGMIVGDKEWDGEKWVDIRAPTDDPGLRDLLLGLPSGTSRSARTPGTTNAPGGEWFSTPAAKRRSKPRNLTLTPEASAALDALVARPGGDNASAEASAAIIERAERTGVKPSRE